MWFPTDGADHWGKGGDYLHCPGPGADREPLRLAENPAIQFAITVVGGSKKTCEESQTIVHNGPN